MQFRSKWPIAIGTLLVAASSSIGRPRCFCRVVWLDFNFDRVDIELELGFIDLNDRP